MIKENVSTIDEAGQPIGMPRAFAYGNHPNATILDIAPVKIEAGDIYEYLGGYHVVSTPIHKKDGSTVLYFKQLPDRDESVPPTVIPSGTETVRVYRPTGRGV